MARRFYEGSYEGADERRRQEREDGMMVKEDRGAIANLPKEVVYMQYPIEGGMMPEDLSDSFHSVDRQMDEDNSQARKHLKPKKV